MINTHLFQIKHSFSYWVNAKCNIFGIPDEKYIITKQHDSLIEMLQDAEFILVMAYRGWGKSEIITFLWTLWRAEQWHEDAIIFSANDQLAKQKLDFIRVTCEFDNNNFAHLCSKDLSWYVWNRDEIWLVDKNNPITIFEQDPQTWERVSKKKYRIISKIFAKSIYSTARWIHVKNILLDDVIVEDNARTFEMREEVKNLFRSAIIPIRKIPKNWQQGSRIIVIWTPQHEEDLLMELSKDHRFLNFELPALDQYEQPTCPELHTKEFIETQKAITRHLFEKEYMLKPMSDHAEIFTYELLNQSKLIDMWFEITYEPWINERVIIWPDFAVIDDKRKAEKKDTDYFSMTCAVLNLLTGKRRILCLFNERWIGINSQIQLLLDWIIRYNASYLCLETHWSMDWARQMIEPKVNNIQIVDTWTSSGKFDKYEWIPSMVYSWEKWYWEVPYWTEECQSLVNILFAQLNQLQGSKHDDLADSLFRVEQFCKWYDQWESSYDPNFKLYKSSYQKKSPPMLWVWREYKATQDLKRKQVSNPLNNNLLINVWLRKNSNDITSISKQ